MESFDDSWLAQWQGQWDFPPGLIYLQHGAKGSPPRPVMETWTSTAIEIQSPFSHGAPFRAQAQDPSEARLTP